MNFVEPIRDRKKIAQIKNQLRGQRRSRDLLLFVVGINTALRISDLLELQVGYFLDVLAVPIGKSHVDIINVNTGHFTAYFHHLLVRRQVDYAWVEHAPKVKGCDPSLV
jgi:hypothetical protein